FATGVAVPLALFLYYTRSLAQPILVAAGLLQTIPSIALLAFMIPLFGIGMKPAIAALFLYSLLPILRNTYTALTTISPALKEAALGIGLHRYESLYFVELPLSLPVIVAGIRITAVINIGTATLAAFIGAGGLGEPIVTGLALNDTHMILAGAIPAALLAIVIELFLEAIERFFQRKYGASS
ncbi:MAG: ABC transporter permease, partial [Deltaproteobacteria bacterium]